MRLEGLAPQNPDLEILGATSDHLLMDTTRSPELGIGDIVSFDLNYGALLTAMTSPFVDKVIL
jgi:predicted amino acid racemase